MRKKNFIKMSQIVGMALSAILMHSCIKDLADEGLIDADPQLPKVIVEQTEIHSPTTVSITAEVIDTGFLHIIENGFCIGYDLSTLYELSNRTRSMQHCKYSITLDHMPDSDVYICSYAINEMGISFSEYLVVNPHDVYPRFGEASIKRRTAYTAVCKYSILSEGDSPVIASGICWSILPFPTTINSHTANGEGCGEYSDTLIYLEPSTHYFVRPYATNARGTIYGEQIDITM